MDIEKELIDDLLKETKAKTKKTSQRNRYTGLLDFKRREKLASLIGNYEYGYTAQELERMRTGD